MAAERTKSKLHDKPLNKNSNSNTNNNNRNNSNSKPMPTASVSSNYPYGISFSSNIAFVNESDDMAYIEKRTAHNALERQRREGLNTKFQELAHVLPELQQIRRPSKSMIVAKSLEYVSKADERESDFQGQLHALRKENEQLMRQASLSKKRMKRRLEQDNMQSIKKSLQPTSSETEESQVTGRSSRSSRSSVSSSSSSSSSNSNNSKKAMAMTLRKRPSKLKPQTRKSSLLASEDFPSPPSKSKDGSVQRNLSTVEAKPIKKKRSIEELEVQHAKQQPQKRERIESTTQSSTSHAAISDATLQQPVLSSASSNGRRKRDVTTELRYQTPSANASTYYNNSTAATSYSTISPHHVHGQYQQLTPVNHLYHHHRYNNHQPTSGIHHQQQQQQGIIPPSVSRHNSLTIAYPNHFHQRNDDLVVRGQFDMTPSPFVEEQIYYNSLEHLDQPIVSSIPAVRTPIGDRNSLINTPSPVTQPYDPTLDILNSIIVTDQQQHHSSDRNQLYDHWP